MNLLYAEKKNDTKLIVLKTLLPFTYIFKMWFLAELEYNTLSSYIEMGIFGRIMTYIVSGGVGYLLAMLAVSISYNIFSRSKYSPCDENFYCRINKPTYTTIAYLVICIANTLVGILNFLAYCVPISIAFVTILLPTIISIFAIVAIIGLMNTCLPKGEFKALITSMALPTIIILLLLR